MRAFNLIPVEQRRGVGGITGRTGGISYVITAGLLALVALGVLYAYSVRDIASDKTALAEVSAQTADVNLQTQSLQPYLQFASLANQSVLNVAALAEQRFDWPRSMQQVALALPSDVTLTSLNASTGGSSGATATPQTPATAASSTAATGATGAIGAAGTVFQVVGCAASQDEVATVITRLRELQGVSSATLQSSQLTAGAKHGGSPLESSGVCPIVTFNATVTYASGYAIASANLSKVPGAAVASSAGAGTQSLPATPATATTQGAG